MTIRVDVGETYTISWAGERLDRWFLSNPNLAAVRWDEQEGVLLLRGTSIGEGKLTISLSDGAYEQDVFVSPQEIPFPPANVGHTPFQEGLEATWSEAADPAYLDAYAVRIRPGTIGDDGTAWTEYFVHPASVHSHTFQSLSDNAPYVLEVSALNSSAAPATVTVQARTLGPPLAPVVAAETNTTNNFFILTPTIAEGSSPAASWDMQYKPAHQRSWPSGLTSRYPENPEFVRREILGGDFDWRVRGVNAAGAGPWTTGTISLPPVLPAKVENATVTDRGAMTWDAPAGTVDHYEVQGPGSDNRTAQTIGPSPERSVYIADGSPWAFPYWRGASSSDQTATDRCVRVRAVNDAGAGPWSDAVAPPATAAPITPVLSAQAQYAGATRLPVSCEGLPENVLYFHTRDVTFRRHGAVRITNNRRNYGVRLWIRRGTSGSWGSAIDLGIPWFEYIPHAFDSLTANTQYQVRCQFYNSAGDSAFSAPLSVTTAQAAQTSPPAKITAADALSAGRQWFPANAALLQWRLPSGSAPATSWEVRYKEEVPGDWSDPVVVSDPTQTRLLLPNRPQPGGSHPWQVRGRNAAGAGPWSDEFLFRDYIEFPMPQSMAARRLPNGLIEVSWERNFHYGEVTFDRLWLISAAAQVSTPQSSIVIDESRAEAMRQWVTFNLSSLAPSAGGELHFAPVFNVAGVGGVSYVAGDYRSIDIPPAGVPSRPDASSRDAATSTATIRIVTFSATTPYRLQFVEQFQLEVATSSDFSTGVAFDEEVGRGTGRTQDIAVTGLVPGTLYYWRVRAWNQNGWSAYDSGTFRTTS